MSNNAFIQRIHSTLQLSTSSLASFRIVISIMTIFQLLIGAVYLDECPRQRYIPIYLMFVGVFELVLAVIICDSPDHEPIDGNTTLRQVCSYLTSAAFICWFITGSWWIYSIYEPNYNKNTTDISTYCNKMLYLYAFWTTTLVYILLGLSLVIGCICLRGRPDPDDNV